MLSCDDCSTLLLDHLYGLLDDEESQSVRAHLAECENCAAALKGAEAERDVLARAALICPRVQEFAAPGAAQRAAPPAETPAPEPIPEAPATLPMPTPRRKPLLRWAVAGAAAAVVLTAGVSSYLYYRGLNECQGELAKARQEVQQVDTRLASTERLYKEEAEKLNKALSASVLGVKLTGPASLQRGAPARFQVKTTSLKGQLAKAKLVAKLIDPKQPEPLYATEVTSEGLADIQIPADLPVRSGSMPRLEIEAVTEGGKARVEELLSVAEPTYLSHLATNKAVYRTGDILFFRALTLERFSLRPPDDELGVTFALIDPAGRAVRQLQGATKHGVAGGEFALSDDLTPGDYTLLVASDRVHAETRALTVVREEQPQVVLDKDSYKPGETVKGQFRGRIGGDGNAIPNQPVTIQATTADGKPIPGGAVQLRSNEKGVATFELPLPKDLPTPDVSLRLQVHDGLHDEELQRKVPVVGPPRKQGGPALTVDFFPEGGELVCGLPGRVYFHARNSAGQPVAIDGKVTDSLGREVARVRTAADPVQPDRSLGAGAFTYTPQTGQHYSLHVPGPAGSLHVLPLPTARLGGVGLTVKQAVAAEGEALSVTVRDTEATRRLLVLATCRGRVVDQQFVTAGREGAAVSLRPLAGARGVIRLTVYEANDRLVPLAERLVYARPAERLVMKALREEAEQAGQGKRDEPEKEAALKTLTNDAAEQLKMSFAVKDEKGKKTDAYLMGAVVQERWRQVAEKAAEQAPGPRLLLTRELRRGEDLEDVDVLLSDTAASREALDLFLGTLGYRRITPQDVQPEQYAAGEATRKAREEARLGRPAVVVKQNDLAEQRERSEKVFIARRDQLRDKTEEARKSLHDERERTAEQARLAAAALDEYETGPRGWLRLGAGIAVLTLLAFGTLVLLGGVVQTLRGAPSARLCFGAAAATLGVCLLTYGLTGSLRTADAPRDAGALIAQLQARDYEPLAAPPRRESDPRDQTNQQSRRAEVLAELPLGPPAEKKDSKEPQGKKEESKSKDDVYDGAGPNRGAKKGGKADAQDEAVMALARLTQTYKNAELEHRFHQLEKAQRPSEPPPIPTAPTPQPIPPGIGLPGGVPGGGSYGGQTGGDPKTGKGDKFGKGKGKDKGGDAKKDPGAGEDKGGGAKQHPGAGKGSSDNPKAEQPKATLREYAYRKEGGATAELDTLLWLPLVETKDGQVSISFDLPAGAGSYRILLYAHSPSGRLGSWQRTLEVVPASGKTGGQR